MIKVILESPFANPLNSEMALNIEYAQRCMHDCFVRGEFPFASHLLYTQENILDDNIPEERELGIQAGLAWGLAADKTVVYADRGISRGMQYGIENAEAAGRPIEYRTLQGWSEDGQII